MAFQLIFKRIMIDGSILAVISAVFLVGILYLKPRLALSDYPPDVRAAVPPRTREELRLGIALSIPLMILILSFPLYSVWILKQQNGGILTYWMAFATILGEYLFFSLFDLLVLDIGMFFTWTPKFLVLPGTQGMAGYKDWKPHAKTQLLQGNLLILLGSVILAGVAMLIL